MTNRLALKTAMLASMDRENDTNLDAAFTTIVLPRVESRFRRMFRLSVQESVFSTSNVSTQLLALPDDFLEARSVTISTPKYRVLSKVTLDVLRQSVLYHNGRGPPEMFAIQNRSLIFAPAPSAATVDVVYFAAFASLVNDDDQNWLTINAFDMYLDALISEAARYVRDFELAAVYASSFMDAAEKLIESDEELMSRGGANISGNAVHGA